MDYIVTVKSASPVRLAAVRVTVPAMGIASAWKPALDKVWAFLRTHPIPNSGHNVFLYHHPSIPGEAMEIDFGVQVLNWFEGEAEVRYVESPEGEVAETLHTGQYSRLGEAHAAIRQWCQAHQRPLGKHSWEVYGHWNIDPDKLQTSIYYLLA